MYPKEAITEFKKLYAKNYGIELSDEEAARRYGNLIAIYGSVYGDDSPSQTEDEHSGKPEAVSP